MNAIYGKLGMDVVNKQFTIDNGEILDTLDTKVYKNINPFNIGNYVYTRYEEADEL
jgi:hypothetical protein